MDKKPRIAIIVPWFGPFPDYMELFVRSVKANPILSYHFWTDTLPPPICENVLNIHFHYSSFDNYCKRASAALGIEFKPDSSYKMCDLKPFYPIIHEEDVKNYEFVGFGDIDLLLGDMNAYLEPILDKIDVFSTHADRVSGHFFFLRNNEKFTHLGYKIRNWRELLSAPNNLGIDEGAFCDVICPLLGIQRRIWHRITKGLSFSSSWKVSRTMSSFSALLIPHRFHFKELHTTHSAISPNVLKYQWSDTEWIFDGRTIKGKNNGKEYPYLHFLFLKTVKELPVRPTWAPGFYKVRDADGIIIISGREIKNLPKSQF